MRLTLICCAYILWFSFTAKAQYVDKEYEERAKRDQEQLALAAHREWFQRVKAESFIVRSIDRALTSDEEFYLTHTDFTGDYLRACYEGRGQGCKQYVIYVTRFILARSPLICLGEQILTEQKLLRILSLWHQDNAHLWPVLTTQQQIEVVLATEYPCPKAPEKKSARATKAARRSK